MILARETFNGYCVFAHGFALKPHSGASCTHNHRWPMTHVSGESFVEREIVTVFCVLSDPINEYSGPLLRLPFPNYLATQVLSLHEAKLSRLTELLTRANSVFGFGDVIFSHILASLHPTP